MESGPNILDLSLMALLAIFLVRALMRGFVREVMGLAGVITAVVVSSMAYEPLGQFLADLAGSKSVWWQVAAFAIILIIIFIFFTYLGLAISRLVNSGPFSGIDRLAGAGVGLIKGVLVCYILLHIVVLVIPFKLPRMLEGSFMTPYVLKAGEFVVDLVPDEFTTNLNKRIERLKNPGQANGKSKNP
jgi:membrane protein required for colicin V production